MKQTLNSKLSFVLERSSIQNWTSEASENALGTLLMFEIKVSCPVLPLSNIKLRGWKTCKNESVELYKASALCL